jgi:hypothetical protein
VIAANVGQGNCGGADMVLDGGHNVAFGDTTCRGAQVDPKLGPLQDNGGPTETITLEAGSGALDLVPPGSDCPAADQRGVARPQGAACDAGAYETAPPTIGGPSASATASTAAGRHGRHQPQSARRQGARALRNDDLVWRGEHGAGHRLGHASVPVTVGLSGLAPGTAYHCSSSRRTRTARAPART